MTQQTLMAQGFLMVETSHSHSDTKHSVGLLQTSDNPVAETSTLQHTSLTRYSRAPWRDSNPKHHQASGRRTMGSPIITYTAIVIDYIYTHPNRANSCTGKPS